MRVFGRDPVADPVGVLCRDRLPVRGPRPARLDARRRAAALHRGRSTRAGTARTPRSCARDFALDPAAKVKHLSQGQRARAGLRAGPGLSARAAGARRAVDGPRPDRPPRHPGGDHPHDRRGRAHGALLVAPARRGRAGGRPRGADRPRPDRASRAARRDQGRRTAGSRCGSTSRGRSRRRWPGRWPGRGRGASGRPSASGAARRACRRAADGCGAQVVDERVPSLDEIFVARVGERVS